MADASESNDFNLSLPQADGVERALNDPVSRIDLVVGDLTQPDPAWGVDAIVNAANESLLGGGGVDGAIHRAAGPRLLEFNRTLDGCPTGLAKASPAFDLEAQGIDHIFHTVGPVWNDAGSDEAAAYAMPGAPLGEAAQLGYLHEDTLLASCYLNCLRLAVQHEAKVVAFPAISTGIYRFPKERAAKIAFGHVFGHFAARPAPEFPHKVLFVCFSEEDAAVYREVIQCRADWMTNRRRV
ncbi:MAG: macro domain-containing protein [Planctomycetota bacterium]